MVAPVRQATRLFALASLLAAGCGEDSTGPAIDAIRLEPVASGLSLPVFLTAPAGDPRLFIVEQGGQIRILQGGQLLTTPFLDIRDRVFDPEAAQERGLLSMAFHPTYSTNGFFFVYYTDNTGDIVIERYSVSSNPNVANPTATRVLTIPHRQFDNHNGGLVTFGPDGFLYLGTGDGGGSGDDLESGQDRNSLLGKLLRINVATLPYTIPPGNPFIGVPNTRPEIWAWGLRNPWRFSFDRVTNVLYIADVGQERVEEVNAVSRTQAGLNFGWSIAEGSGCFVQGCNLTGLTRPVHEYLHSTGGCSIIGGFAYRGSQIPELAGRYFFSDFCAGFLRSFLFAGGRVSELHDWEIPDSGQMLSFGEDSAGELYMLSMNGTVYRLARE